MLTTIADWAGGDCPAVAATAVKEAAMEGAEGGPLAAGWVHRVAKCACAQQVALRGGETACDPRWLENGRRADGSWVADGAEGATLEWLSPLLFARGAGVAEAGGGGSEKKKPSRKGRAGKRAKSKTNAKLKDEGSFELLPSVWVGFQSPDEHNKFDPSFNGLYRPQAPGAWANLAGRLLYYSPAGKSWYFNTEHTPARTAAFGSLTAPHPGPGGFPPAGLRSWQLSRTLRQESGGVDWAAGQVRLQLVPAAEVEAVAAAAAVETGPPERIGAGAVRHSELKLKIPAWVFCMSWCPDFEFRGTCRRSQTS